MTNLADSLLGKIVAQYQGSQDFNGLPVHALDLGDDAAPVVIELIEARKVDLVRGDGHPNPHIKAFAAEPVAVQIKKIKEQGPSGCLYPTPETLAALASQLVGAGPFTRELELGSPQLDYRVFDTRVLEWYRNDPRYEYDIDEIHGRITQKAGTVGKDGAVLMDNLEFFEFGFAYDDDLNRGVAAFIRYLHDLPADQQRYIDQFKLTGDYKLHPEFYRTQILGEFPERISIYDAFLEEKHHINEMCKLMKKPPMFRGRDKAYQRPHGFGILLRPTKKEFRDFVLLLDQLLSDDLDREFFKGDIPVAEVLTKEDGTKVTQPIGTITLLQRWMTKEFKPSDPAPIERLFAEIRAIRKERQKPAHVADDNEFDQKYLKQQRELIEQGFDAVGTIRMALENHPLVRGYEIPEWLREGKVWSI